MEAINQVLTSLDFKLNSRIVDAMVNPKTETERLALILTAANQGLFVFQTNATKGIYIWDGTAWIFYGDSTSMLSAVTDLRTYVDTKDAAEVTARAAAITGLETALHTYSDTGSAAALVSAKAYADTLRSATDASIAASLVTAKAFADTQDLAVKANLLSTIATLEISLKAYSDSGNLTSLNAAKAHANALNTTVLASIAALEVRMLAVERVTQDGFEIVGVNLMGGVDYILVLPKAMKSKNTFSKPNIMNVSDGRGIESTYWSIDPTHIGFRVNTPGNVNIYVELDFA